MQLEYLFGQLHPVVVHFPIGLLTLYALIEIFSIKKIASDSRWTLVKRVLLFCGTLGVLMATQTGEGRGGENIQPGTPLAYHEQVATITESIFIILAGSELVIALTARVTRMVSKREWLYVIWKVLEKIARFLALRPLRVAIALLGLWCLLLTGTLGGGMVYGPEADPLVSLVYKILKLK